MAARKQLRQAVGAKSKHGGHSNVSNRTMDCLSIAHSSTASLLPLSFSVWIWKEIASEDFFLRFYSKIRSARNCARFEFPLAHALQAAKPDLR